MENLERRLRTVEEERNDLDRKLAMRAGDAQEIKELAERLSKAEAELEEAKRRERAAEATTEALRR